MLPDSTEPSDATMRSGGRESTGSADARSPGILIVDDSADMRRYMRGCLRKLGLKELLEAADGAEALRLTREKDVALVISDVIMPKMDGIALCHAIKSDPELAGVRVLIVSGEVPDPPSDMLQDAFLRKPFNTATLRRSVSDLLSLTED